MTIGRGVYEKTSNKTHLSRTKGPCEWNLVMENSLR